MKMSRNKPLLALALLLTMSQVLAQSTSLRGSTFRDLKKKKDKESPLERAKTSGEGGKHKGGGGGGRTRKGAQEAIAATKRDNRSSVLNELFPAGLKSNMGGGMGMGTGGSTDAKAGEEEYASEEDEAGIDVDQKFLARAKEVQSARHKETKNGGKKSMGKRDSSSADGGAALDCGGSSSGKKSGKKSNSSSSNCDGADKTSNLPPPSSPYVVALTQVPTTVPTAQQTFTPGGSINTALFMVADCSPSNPCKVCEGDCDSDADCEGNLKCKERLNDEPVPGCSGTGVAGKDYCYAETTTSPTPAPVNAPLQLTMISENNGDCTLTNRCGRCEGDCDGDLHCEEGLICFQRNGFMAVPGCEGEGMSGKDYCIHPDSIVNTPVPAVTPQPTASPTATAKTAVPGSTPPPTKSPTKSPTATAVTPAPTAAPVVATASTPTSAPVLVQDITEGGFVLTPTSAPVAPPPPTSAPVAPPPPTSVAPPPPTSAPVAPPPPTKTPVASTPAPINQSPDVNIKSIIEQAAKRFPKTDFSSPEAYQAKALKWAETSLPSVKPSVEDIIEYYGLACLYFATNGVSNYWFDQPAPWFESTKWLDPSGNGKCSWLGVRCNESTGRVESIDLHANNLNGGIPDEIALLADHLTALDLEENQFDNYDAEGTNWMGELTELRYLNFFNNYVEYSGGLPPSLANLINIEVLIVGFNIMSGPIDGAIFAKMNSLKYLDISLNEFASAIPTEIGNRPNLLYLYADEAAISGNLDFIKNMSKIIDLQINFNQGLAGTIPSAIGNLKDLQVFDASGCALTGTIPTTFGLLQNLSELILYDNFLKGGIPSEMANMNSLTILELELNDIAGTMPAGVCSDRNAGQITFLGTDCDDTVTCSCCDCCGLECFQ